MHEKQPHRLRAEGGEEGEKDAGVCLLRHKCYNEGQTALSTSSATQ